MASAVLTSAAAVHGDVKCGLDFRDFTSWLEDQYLSIKKDSY